LSPTTYIKTAFTGEDTAEDDAAPPPFIHSFSQHHQDKELPSPSRELTTTTTAIISFIK